jgi:hypothetical protein
MHQVKKPVINRLRLVKTKTGLDWSKTAKNRSSVVQSSFLTYWDFSGSVSVLVHVPERQKLDWTGTRNLLNRSLIYVYKYIRLYYPHLHISNLFITYLAIFADEYMVLYSQ